MTIANMALRGPSPTYKRITKRVPRLNLALYNAFPARIFSAVRQVLVVGRFCLMLQIRKVGLFVLAWTLLIHVSLSSNVELVCVAALTLLLDSLVEVGTSCLGDVLILLTPPPSSFFGSAWVRRQ